MRRALFNISNKLIYLQDSGVCGVKCFNIFCIRKWLTFVLRDIMALYGHQGWVEFSFKDLISHDFCVLMDFNTNAVRFLPNQPINKYGFDVAKLVLIQQKGQFKAREYWLASIENKKKRSFNKLKFSEEMGGEPGLDNTHNTHLIQIQT